ncbi:pentapeptide repeat-containing protein [Nostoc sp. LPT]|uniref:pentapeptide repeat-containing protein n=1 Tax=Nostoc sp. LPT TaxID=2815387 RepID=UPI001D8883C1|nr:pentapeptide repeat-containing protein [Nostoc sp. LPT]MBN4003578.1 pentapeptide repeat-containing protein [Nostoc sp. LPT]
MPQDYSGQNLRGRSFKGQNLEGANFSGADIRGADFTNATLIGANFSHATAGLQRRWATVLVIVSWAMAGGSGFLLARFSELLYRINIKHPVIFIIDIISVILLVVFSVITIRKSLTAGLGAFVFAYAVTASFALIFSVDLNFTLTATVIFAVTFVFAGAFAAAVAGAGGFAIAIAVAVAIIGAYIRIEASTLAILTFPEDKNLTVTFAINFAIAVACVCFSAYIGWRSIAIDEKYAWVRSVAIAFVATGGTSFRNADLSSANLTGASLKSTDFRDAILACTRFHKTKMLDRVRPGTTYLQNAQVCQLLVTGQGQNKNFHRQSLRDVNLQRANLIDASFIGTDLSQANLQDADLSRAKLVQAQLDGTDFTGATLTGAYIQDWGITTDTKFDEVRCEYVYMRLPTKENPDPLRKPDNNKEVFADGEFGDFIQPIFDTLDLYHNQGVDPRAIAISFKQLAENHPEADLRIVGMEVRGEDKFLLRAKTADTADKSQLSAEYFDTYNEIKSLPEREIRLLLSEKDNQIRRLENMVMTALQSPKFYSENYNNQGDTGVTGDRNINTGGGNYNERIERDYIQGNYYAAGQPQSLAQAAAEIQQLLKQLEQTYPTTTTSQQMVVAAEALNRIESNPLLKERVINAVKGGGLAAFEKAIDNPAGAFIVGAIKGWQEVDAPD